MNPIKIILLIFMLCLISPVYAGYYAAYTNPAVFSCDDCTDSWPLERTVMWVPGYFDQSQGWISPRWQKMTYADIAFYNQPVDCVHSAIQSPETLPLNHDYNETNYSLSSQNEYEGIADFNYKPTSLEGIRDSGIDTVEASLDSRTGDDVGDDLQVN